jgi:HSP20 family protein
MTTLPAAQKSHSLFPEFGEFFAGFPSFAGIRPLFDPKLMRLEDEIVDGRYEVRAEIPGIDPAKDVDITIRNGQLTIKAERSEKKEFEGRSEFSYGSFVRSVTLPPGADEDDITATYDKGILTVSVRVAEAQPAQKRIEVKPAN